MKVLVIGGGGREHALAWAIAQSPRVKRVYMAPGNGGTTLVGERVDMAATDAESLMAFAADRAIDLTVIGPEAPLVAGVVDKFQAAGLRCYGPRRDAARLEGSKVYAKEFMRRHSVPTADFDVFDDPEEAKRHARKRGAPIVVKADGLAAGKGVIVATKLGDALDAIDDIMVNRAFGESGARVVLEECLEGEEVSVHAICAGERAFLLPSSQDHKRAWDGDEGPNTGGMGAYAPVPSFTRSDMDEVRDRIIEPTLRGLTSDGIEYTGTLYAGLMRTKDGPRVLEFNVRFGDPETQAIVPLVRGDFFELLYASASGELPDSLELWPGRSAATVVMASQGYPGSYRKGILIDGVDDANAADTVVFHAGTARATDGLVTAGGRVLAVTAWGDDIRTALSAAYRGVGKIHFEGAFWRKDIGHRAM
jgi:phosphoribosylamine--glycine ligase